jgi:hypothetical protein
MSRMTKREEHPFHCNGAGALDQYLDETPISREDHKVSMKEIMAAWFNCEYDLPSQQIKN